MDLTTWTEETPVTKPGNKPPELLLLAAAFAMLAAASAMIGVILAIAGMPMGLAMLPAGLLMFPCVALYITELLWHRRT